MRKRYAVLIDRTAMPVQKYRKCRWEFFKYGLRRDGNQVTGDLSLRKYEKLNEYCRSHKIKLKLNNQFAIRSLDYRQVFFRNNPGVFGHRYFCSYCGKLLSRKDVTVDHLYPVNAAQTDLRMQKKLKRNGYKNINDPKNLVPACMRCNKKKGAGMGRWILKGKIGRHPSLWILRKAFRITLVSIGLYVLYLHHYSILSALENLTF